MPILTGALSCANARGNPAAAASEVALTAPSAESARRRVHCFKTRMRVIAFSFDALRRSGSPQRTRSARSEHVGARQTRGDTCDAFRLEQDDEEERQTHEQRPVLAEASHAHAADHRAAGRPAGNEVAQNHEQNCTRYRTVKRSRAANDRHYDDLSGESPEQHIGRDEWMSGE